jgi:hypothetical protein
MSVVRPLDHCSPLTTLTSAVALKQDMAFLDQTAKLQVCWHAQGGWIQALML